MREIHFIRALVVELLPMCDPDEVRYHMMDATPPVPVSNGPHDVEFMLTDREIQTQVVSVHRLRKGYLDGTVSDKYIAYSKEVQELLEMPFDVMKKEKERMYHRMSVLDDKLDRVQNASFWNRLKFAFTGNHIKLYKR